jgi:tRNA(Arg) A34 adenosine deaminase TadA
MMAQMVRGSFTLGGPDQPDHVLYTSCEPCAMCLGATLWSGVKRVVWAALRDDANRLSFDEGPVFPESYDYLRERGIAFESGVLRDEGREVLELYRGRGGIIYNG